MDFKAQGKIYTLRDWLNSKEYTILTSNQFTIMKKIGPLCDWDQAKMEALSQDPLEMMKTMAKSDISLDFINEATDSVIQSMLADEVEVDALPAELVGEMRLYVTKLLTELESKKA